MWGKCDSSTLFSLAQNNFYKAVIMKTLLWGHEKGNCVWVVV